ncbi:hypothetical protein Cgig2_031352 [Carnegiea gigantea]|uniref:DUF4283 domain-containing protein n=1 Tax=Carnegiea gigantea TaxID=171969 RepID=A0A9Q1JIG3_9CARY|nr:hypothetical protein Cgig2_031352 [Carnegiea gigantea]
MLIELCPVVGIFSLRLSTCFSPGLAILLFWTQEEEEVVEFEKDVLTERKDEIALNLLGKLFTHSNVNMEAMKTIFKNNMVVGQSLVVRELERNLFLFQFSSRKDRESALNEGLWAFDGCLLLLKEWTGLEQVSKAEFNHAQLYNKRIACMLIDKIKSFMGCEEGSMYGANKSHCFKVIVDVRKPLRRGLIVKMDGKSI